MSSLCVCQKILFSYIIILLTTNIKIIKSGKGILQSTLVNATECVDPKPLFDKMDRRILTSKLEVYLDKTKRKMIRGNLTVLGNTTGIMGRLSYGIQYGKTIRWKYALNKINCHSLFSSVLRGLKNSIPMNSKTCTIKKGTYQIMDLDVTKLDTTLYIIPQMGYGLATWLFMIYTTHGANVCYEIKILVTK